MATPEVFLWTKSTILSLGMISAELRNSPTLAVRWPFPTLLVDGIHHPVLGIFTVKLSLSPILAVRGTLCAPAVAAPPAVDAHHPVLGMLGTELRLSSPKLSLGWLLGAPAVNAPLVSDVHHPILRMMFSA